MRFHTAALAATLSAVAVTAPTGAESTTLVASGDGTLYESATGALANGAGDWLFAGRTGGGVRRRGLLRFDLSAIPAGARIDAVTLSLTHSQGQPVTAAVEVHRALAAWGEGTSNADGNEGAGAPATPGDATWLHTSFATAFWTTPGGDLAPEASAVTPVGPAIGLYTWTGAGLVADVQAWVDGAASNDGWILVGDEASAGGTAKRFSTHEHPVRRERPTLVVEWTPPAPPADIDGDGIVGPADLALLLGSWGQPGAADLDGDGAVGPADLAILLGAWTF